MTAEEVPGPVGELCARPSSVGESKLLPDSRLEELLNDHNQALEHCPSQECATVADSEEPFCRICHEGKASGELLSPCECCGTLALVHQACLEHWLTASNSSHCELCHHQFALERLQKPLSEWLCSPSMQQQRRTLCGDVVCFLFITPLASLSGWLCVQGALDLYYTNGMEAVGLLFLTLALFTIYVFWTVVSVRYHMQLFKTWRKTEQAVRLQLPPQADSTPNPQSLSINILCKDTTKETMV